MTRYYGFSRPPQKISEKEKTKQWFIENIDSISIMTSTTLNSNRSDWKQKKVCYDAVNSILDTTDSLYKSITDPYSNVSTLGKQPGSLMDINLIANKVNALKGDELSRPFNFQVIGLNGGAISAREEKRKELLIQTSIAELARELGVSMEPQIDPNTGEEIPLSFSQVDKFLSYSYSDIREKMGNDILKYLEYQQKLHAKFSDNFENVLIVAEEIYRIEIINDEPVVRVVNPISFEFDFNPDDPIIENGDVFKEERIMTIGQILDEFRDYLTEDDIDKLDKGRVFPNGPNGQYPGFAYTMDTLEANRPTRTNSTNAALTVIYATWKGMKQIGFVSYPDEKGITQEGIVSKDFVLTKDLKEAGYEVEWKWIPTFYSGVKIGEDIYVKYGEEKVQFRSLDNPSKVKGPYVGRVYGAKNSKQTSLVDLLLPHQKLYNVVWYKLIQELAKAKGKKMVMDLAQIPKSQGIDLDKWMYLFDNVGVAFINSFEEGPDKFQGDTSKFNQFSQVDMTVSQSIGQYISILAKIEQTVDRISGVSPQREGATFASESATGNQNAINQSSFITEYLFYEHNEVKKSVLESLLEAAKIAYPENKKLHYIIDDVCRVMLNLDMEKFADSDYGIFVSNSVKDNRILSKLEELSNHAVSSGMASLSDLAKIFKAQSSIEIIKTLEASEEKKRQMEQEQAKQQERITQMNIEAAQAEKEKEREFIATQNQLDRENKIREKVISTMGFDTDTKDNSVIDVVEQGKIALEQSKLANDSLEKSYERNHTMLEAEKDRQLKRDELSSKEKIEKLKAETALKNKTAGEK